jgi:hypothetical protein
MTCPAATTRLANRLGDTWARRASDAPCRGGGTADGLDRSAATIAVSGSRFGCRAYSGTDLNESMS